mgnify:CR=1 FL=1
MADEKLSLLFRRGTIDQILAGDKIVPGAVSFCTDEPGIYLDLTAAEGGGTAKRVRVGDFITVASFDDIKAQATAAADPDKAFSEHCLYYSIKENALMKYNKTAKEFIIINDLSEVKGDIEALGVRVTANEGSIKTLTTNLANETTRATNAEAALSNRIDALTGGGDGSTDSLTKLRADLNTEIAAREDGDEALQGSITALTGRVSTNEGAISALQTLVGELPDGVATNIVAYINAEILKEQNRATGIENGLRTDVDKNTGDISTLSTGLTDEIARAKLAEQANATAAANAQTKADEAATAAANEASRAIGVEGELRTLITNLTNTHTTDKNALEQSITTLTSNLATTTGVANDAKAQSDTNKAGLAQELLDRAAGDQANAKAIEDLDKELGEEVERLEGLIGNASSSADAVQKNLDAEVEARKAADQANSQAIAGVDASLEQEKKDRAAADTTLDGKITTVSQGLAATDGRVSTLENWQTDAKVQIKNLEDFADDAQDAIEQEVQDRQTAINNVNNALDSEAAARSKRDEELTNLIDAESKNRATAIANALTEAANTADQKDQALLALINQNMAAANSMTFKGEVTGYDSLPASGIKAGDTYVVTTAFGNAESEPQIGDLLVASADQADGATLADAAAKKAFFIWVKTGYSTFNDPSLVVEDAVIKMKSHLGEVLGTVAVASASENIVTSISGTGKDCTVNVSFVWGTF